MKIILFTATLILNFTLLVCNSYAAKTPAEKLIERLHKLQKKGYMYGHQDDPFYGITWDWDANRSDTYELVGDYPAVMGFDLGGIEVGDSKNLDSVPFTRIRETIIKHHSNGGIITISWHPRNPLLGTTAWIEKDTVAYKQAISALKQMRQDTIAKKVINPQKTVASILPGGSQHAKFRTWMSRITDFLKTLKTDKGQPIPVILRPWHENNGSWFWWGQNNCTDEEFHGLWNMLQDYVNKELPTSIVWSYSPNLDGYWNEQRFLKRYPGDNRVSLIGEDAYQWGKEEDFKKQLTADLEFLTKFSNEHGKLLALTECGYQNSPDSTWWTRVFKTTIEKYPVCYFLPWRNYSKDHFGASKDAKTANDFKLWYAEKKFLFLKDIKKIK
ncbi:MAG: glycoside hydrolase family 26 protein [Bacteroidaceae bacterium]|nr:glycoside hydrolase family 26 protein [Bacteroidaceae bacterium]